MQLLCTWATPHRLARDRLRGRAPLSLCDISPHSGETPLKGSHSSEQQFSNFPLDNLAYYAYNTHKPPPSPPKGGSVLVDFSNLRFDDRAPVYQQIAEYLKRQILLGTVQDGDPMPSRRELAAQTGINPNTAQKAYRLMTEEGYVVTDGNSGSFVRLTPALREQISEELTRGLVEQFVTQAKANRLSYKKVIALVSDLWGDED